MTEMAEMASVLASFSSLNIVKNSGREESKTNWASDGHREILDDNNEDEEDVLDEHGVPSAPSPVVSSPVANATARTRLGKFDYGIMARSRTPVENHGYASSSAKRRLNQLPKEFMLASNMLSIRDPWEDAAASKFHLPVSFENEC